MSEKVRITAKNVQKRDRIQIIPYSANNNNIGKFKWIAKFRRKTREKEKFEKETRKRKKIVDTNDEKRIEIIKYTQFIWAIYTEYMCGITCYLRNALHCANSVFELFSLLISCISLLSVISDDSFGSCEYTKHCLYNFSAFDTFSDFYVAAVDTFGWIKLCLLRQSLSQSVWLCE